MASSQYYDEGLIENDGETITIVAMPPGDRKISIGDMQTILETPGKHALLWLKESAIA